MRNGGGRKKSKAQMAADTLCYSLVILTIVSGMLYVFFGGAVFSLQHNLWGHTAFRLFWD